MYALSGAAWLLLGAVAAIWWLMPGPANAQSNCEPRPPLEQLQQSVAVIDVTMLEIVPTETRAEVHLSIDRVVKDETGTLAVGGTLTLPTSRPGSGVVSEVPFNEGWLFWRLFLTPLEPGSADLTTSLCTGSSMIPAPAGQ
jgi:hypothetical protein